MLKIQAGEQEKSEIYIYIYIFVLGALQCISLDIALKGIEAVFIYNMLREGVPKSNGIWEKRIQVVVETCRLGLTSV